MVTDKLEASEKQKNKYFKEFEQHTYWASNSTYKHAATVLLSWKLIQIGCTIHDKIMKSNAILSWILLPIKIEYKFKNGFAKLKII